VVGFCSTRAIRACVAPHERAVAVTDCEAVPRAPLLSVPTTETTPEVTRGPAHVVEVDVVWMSIMLLRPPPKSHPLT
jgi:hypothetical protein